MPITYFAATLFASSWGAVAFLSVWSDTITANAAFWGIVVGFGGNLVAKLLAIFGVVTLPVYLDPFVIGIGLSTATIVAVSRHGTPTPEERRQLRAIHAGAQEPTDSGQTAVTLRCVRAMMFAGVTLSLLLIVLYARPYQRAAQAGTAVSGELVLAIACGGALVVAGALAPVWTRRACGAERERGDRQDSAAADDGRIVR